MSFFFSNAAPTRPRGNGSFDHVEEATLTKESLYHELITQRPALLDEKVKLHARIIDEFNLLSLEKLPREDLAHRRLRHMEPLRQPVGRYPKRSQKVLPQHVARLDTR